MAGGAATAEEGDGAGAAEEAAGAAASATVNLYDPFTVCPSVETTW
jgi:hypothetical protein